MSDEHDPGDDAPEAGDDGSVHGCPTSDANGQQVIYPTREQYLDVAKALADDGYTMALDVCGVDYLQHMDRPLPAGVVAERFEVVVQLLDIGNGRRTRLRVQIPESDPTIPTLFDLHPGTEASERETYDMFGIEFEGHPDLTRILMPEDWDGHPLRKDYAIGAIPVQFKGANA